MEICRINVTLLRRESIVSETLCNPDGYLDTYFNFGDICYFLHKHYFTSLVCIVSVKLV